MNLINEKDMMDLDEDKKLLEAKVVMYKEEISMLKHKLEYAGNLFALYEGVINCAKEETKDITDEIKKLKSENEEMKKKINKLEKTNTSKKTIKKN